MARKKQPQFRGRAWMQGARLRELHLHRVDVGLAVSCRQGHEGKYMISDSSLIGAVGLALILAGCSAGGAGGGAAGGDRIVVRLDPSIPDLAAATIVAERDCTAHGGQAYLLTPPSGASADASAGSRSAVFACHPVARQSSGGNQAGGAAR